MVSAALIQSKVNYGLGKAGAIIGTTYHQFRPDPSAPVDPITRGNFVRTVTAAFDTQPTLKFTVPAKFGNPVYYAAADTSLMRQGDYLCGTLGTFFVATIEPLKPAECIRCNATVTLARPPGATEPGLNAYGGQTTATNVIVLNNWPAAVLIKSRGAAGPVDLPGDERFAVFEIMLPPIEGIEIRTSDILTDNQYVDGAPRRFTITAAELSPLGWRLQAQITVT